VTDRELGRVRQWEQMQESLRPVDFASYRTAILRRDSESRDE
jgi:hypothetical protein